LKASQLFLKEKLPKRTLRKSDPFFLGQLSILGFSFSAAFSFHLKRKSGKNKPQGVIP